MTKTIPPGAVVVGIDGSEHSDRALREAITLARLGRRHLHLVHAYDPMPWRYLYEVPVVPYDEIGAGVRASAQTVLDRARSVAVEKLPEADVSTALAEDDPRHALQEASTTAHTLVLGSHGRGALRSLTLGSVSVHLAQHATCPVVIARPRPRRTATDRIFVGVDGTEVSAGALRFAFEQASDRRAPLTVVHCFEDVFLSGYELAGLPEEELVDLRTPRLTVAKAVAGFREDYPDVAVAVELGRGRAASYLAQASARAVMLVVGARRAGGARFFPGGSTSRAVVEHGKCTVVVVPGKAASVVSSPAEPVAAARG